MIFVRDKGQMCNNILQYGHVYAWAREHGRSVMSMRFSHKYRYFRLCHDFKHNPLFYAIIKFLLNTKHIKSVSYLVPLHTGSTEYENYIKNNNNIVVEGWYIRYYDLFLKYRKEITDMFAFDKKIIESVNRKVLCHHPKDNLRLGIHIRRGDYRTFHNGRFYYDDDVYISYIQRFTELYKDKSISVFICGNDPKLKHQYYMDRLQKLDVVFPNGNPAEDLYVLSECDYLIGPPSTFSLVAAMYNDIPLLWMMDAKADNVLHNESWGLFENLFKNIL